MDKRKISLIKNTVSGVLDSSKVELNRIVLFGSYAKNEQTVDSDIDLIIVSKNFRNDTYFKRIDKVLNLNSTLVKTLKKPFDVLLYSDIEWNDSATMMIREAKKNGKTLYQS
ncbi:MAG: nucleotidyltransferase domain-containing protein [Ignavibacteria bacterium]|nr:nucleotidyltransferase domain-containing protein [Ignavibacteria bacterium]